MYVYPGSHLDCGHSSHTTCPTTRCKQEVLIMSTNMTGSEDYHTWSYVHPAAQINDYIFPVTSV